MAKIRKPRYRNSYALRQECTSGEPLSTCLSNDPTIPETPGYPFLMHVLKRHAWRYPLQCNLQRWEVVDNLSIFHGFIKMVVTCNGVTFNKQKIRSNNFYAAAWSDHKHPVPPCCLNLDVPQDCLDQQTMVEGTECLFIGLAASAFFLLEAGMKEVPLQDQHTQRNSATLRSPEV